MIFPDALLDYITNNREMMRVWSKSRRLNTTFKEYTPCNIPDIPFHLLPTRCSHMILGATQEKTKATLLCLLDGQASQLSLRLDSDTRIPVDDWRSMCEERWFACGLRHVTSITLERSEHESMSLFCHMISARALTRIGYIKLELQDPSVMSTFLEAYTNVTLPNLYHLEVRGIDDAGMISLARRVGEVKQSLTSFSFQSHDPLSQPGIDALIQVCAHTSSTPSHSSDRTLEIQGLKIGTYLTQVVQAASKLQTLRLHGEGDLRALALAKQSLQSLKTIHIDQSEEEDEGYTSFQPLAEACGRGYLPALTTLILYGISISSAEMGIFVKALSEVPMLTSLAIGSCGITDVHIRLFQTASMKSITQLDMTGNELDPNAMQSFHRVSQSGAFSFIKTLDLGLNELGDHGIENFSSSLPYLPSLRNLIISHTRMGDDGLTRFVEAYAKSAPLLQSLQLDGNAFGSLGMKNFSSVLALHPHRFTQMSDLTFAYNSMDDDGIVAFFEACKPSTVLASLRTLNFDSTNMGAQGMSSLVNACGALTQLERLILADNQIGDEGMKSLEHACTNRFPRLNHLDLIGNQIGDEGMRSLSIAYARDVLPECKYLRLHSNPASAEAMKAVRDALRKHVIYK